MRLLAEIVQEFGKAAAGICFAINRSGAVALAFIGCELLLSGCLVTDAIELPTESPSTPTVRSRDAQYQPGTVITVDSRAGGQVSIPLQIRDEDTQETLAVRWQIVTGREIPRTPLYGCPEPTSQPTGSVDRQDVTLNVLTSQFPPGACSTLEIAVSSNFRPCTDPNYYDVTSDPARAVTVGRLTLWFWEISMDPFTDRDAAQQLLSSCSAQAARTTAAPSGTVSVMEMR